MGSREGGRRQRKGRQGSGRVDGGAGRAAGHLPAQPADRPQGAATDTAQQQCPGLRGRWTWERVQPEGVWGPAEPHVPLRASSSHCPTSGSPWGWGEESRSPRELGVLC